MQKKINYWSHFCILVLFFPPPLVVAGSIDSPATMTAAESAMYTIEDVYNRLDTGVEGTMRTTTFNEPTTAPSEGSSWHNLNELMSKAPVIDATQGATTEQVLLGKTYWGLQSSSWGIQTGTMENVGSQNITPSTSEQVITQGYHDGTGKVATDSNLLSENIKSGVTLFGVTGQTEVIDSTTGDAVADDLLSGKKAWVDGLEITGSLTTQTLNTANDNITAGVYSVGKLSTIDSDLKSANIKAGVTIFGIIGQTEVVNTSTGDALAEELLNGKKAWVDGLEITGSLATQTLVDSSDTVTAGNYAATTLSAVDSDLATANIASGVTIFGIAGKTEVVDTTTGDAIAGDLLNGKKAWVDGLEITGSLATQTLVDSSDTVTAGNYAATTLSAVDSDLATANIASGVTIFGIAGKTEVVDTTTGDAVATDILSGKKAWVDGVEITGSLATVTLDNTTETVTAGNYAATTLSAVDSDLITANIVAGVTIFGITGKTEVVDTSSGDAVAANICTGKKAWVAGVEIMGTGPAC